MVLDDILIEVEENRERLTNTLLVFAETDTVLFPFNEACRDCFNSVVLSANKILNSSFVLTLGLDVPVCNLKQKDKLRIYLDSLSLFRFVLLYLVAVEVRSVLLGILFVEQEISVNELLNTAFFEEMYQQNKWGETDESTERYNTIKVKLTELEKLGNENSLYEN